MHLGRNLWHLPPDKPVTQPSFEFLEVCVPQFETGTVAHWTLSRGGHQWLSKLWTAVYVELKRNHLGLFVERIKPRLFPRVSVMLSRVPVLARLPKLCKQWSGGYWRQPTVCVLHSVLFDPKNLRRAPVRAGFRCLLMICSEFRSQQFSRYELGSSSMTPPKVAQGKPQVSKKNKLKWS